MVSYLIVGLAQSPTMMLEHGPGTFQVLIEGNSNADMINLGVMTVVWWLCVELSLVNHKVGSFTYSSVGPTKRENHH